MLLFSVPADLLPVEREGLFMMKLGALGFALVMASATAQATELKPIQGATIALGGVTGVAYYTIEPDGYHVVATVAAGYDTKPIRFKAVLTDGQKLLMSVPGAESTTPSKLEVARSGERVTISDSPVLLADME